VPRTRLDFQPPVILHDPVTEVAGGGETRPGALLRLLQAIPAMLIVIGIVCGVLGIYAVMAALVVLGVLIGIASSRIGAPARIRARLGGRQLDARGEPRLFNLLEGLCVANGLPLPKVDLLEDDSLNAIVLGHGPKDAVLVLTSGLLSAFDRMELEAVLAHELAHVRRGDLASAAGASVSLALVACVMPCARAVRHLAGSRREPIADAIAARMTRYPPGLIAALKKLERAESVRPRTLSVLNSRLTAGLWCVPLDESRPRTTIPGLLDLDLRIAALREL
jgi:heat shock protein HtpX